MSDIGLPSDFLRGGSSSFTEFLRRVAPEQLPGRELAGGGQVPEVPHGTTIVAATCADGVVMAGDRRATAGSMIAQRDIEKVFGADDLSMVGIAGSAGIAVEMVRLFRVELEHYEKIEGTLLSLEGKSNRLASMIRGNLAMAMQGLVVVPLFAGWDAQAARGRIFSFDATGGRYEEHGFHTVGSGSVFARGSLKKLHDRSHDIDTTVMALLQSLHDAADDDSGTGGADLQRRIFPVVMTATADGVRRLSDDEVGRRVDRIITGRHLRPDGPAAPVVTTSDADADDHGEEEAR